MAAARLPEVAPRTLLVFLLAMAAAAGATPPGCVGSLPVGSFRLTVQPEKGGAARPLRALNHLQAGQKLRYEPVKIPDAVKQKAEVALLLVPPSEQLIVLEPRAAGKSAEWKVPANVSIVALVFGPHGLSVKKVKSLVGGNEEVLAQLADYAEQTEKIESLVEVLANSEASGGSLDAALAGFATQYGVSLPKVDAHGNSEQQAGALLKALVPSVAAYDPLNPRSTLQQSSGLAASLAAMFFGTPVGLLAGGASLFQNLRVAMFPETEFRSAIAHAADQDGMQLCARPQKAKAHTRVAYLWAHRIPGQPAPAASLPATPHLQVGEKAEVKIAGLPHPERAHDWRLAAAGSQASFPVAVSGGGAGSVTLDLAASKAPAGVYRLTALWDWEPFEVRGTLQLHAAETFDSLRLTQASRDRLVETSGRVAVELTGADFEFVDKVEIRKEGGRASTPVEFTLPRGRRAGEQRVMEAEIDTGSLGRGSYQLLLAQSGQKTKTLPVTIHPPAPKFENLPVRVNLGETSQPLALRSTAPERIESIASPAGEITLASGAASITLREGLKAGEEYPIQVKLRDIEQPMTVKRAIVIAGPRPAIAGVRKSFAGDAAAALRPGEVPAGAQVSFELSVDHLDAGARVDLACGERSLRAEARTAGAGVLFFSADPGAVGQSGCELKARVTVPATGTSAPADLGRVVLLPRIEQFHLTDEKLGDSIYAGVIEGQNLETIARTGWDDRTGLPVEALPTTHGADGRRQTLKIALPWPAPSPHAPLFVWLRGEPQGRATGVKY